MRNLTALECSGVMDVSRDVSRLEAHRRSAQPHDAEAVLGEAERSSVTTGSQDTAPALTEAWAVTDWLRCAAGVGTRASPRSEALASGGPSMTDEYCRTTTEMQGLRQGPGQDHRRPFTLSRD